MQKLKRKEFTDKQKAEIFARDKAMCAFSGKSLWILDYDLCPTYDIDWVDHIKPAMKGGDNSVENGVCASSFFNAKKKDNSHDNTYFFFAGTPTRYFYEFYEFIPEHTAEHIQKFQNLHWTDWYFNRALWMFMLALEYRFNPYLSNGKKQIRDDEYYIKACFKRITEWKKLVERNNVANLTERGIFDPQTASNSQIPLFSLSEVASVDDVFKLLDELFPLYKDNCMAFEEFLEGVPFSKFGAVTRRMKEIVL